MKKRTRFIENYMNTIYAIVFGFGFVEIIKDIYSSNTSSNFFSGDLIFQMVMALFVLFVICLYWWDWAENLQTKAEGNFLEFLIDMGIGLTLLIILFNFDNLSALIQLFILISILDLMWAINILRVRKEEPFIKKRTNYIIQKVLAVFFFGIAWYLMLEIPGKYLKSIPLFVSFVLVRLICFRNRPVDDKQTEI